MQRLFGNEVWFAILPLLAGCGGAPGEGVAGGAGEEVGSVSSAVQGGSVDSDPSHAYAVVIQLPGSLCSGTLIAPNLVLTARHCVAEPSGGVNCAQRFPTKTLPASELSVSTSRVAGGSYGNGQSVSYAGSVIVVPDGDELCGNDIALIQLASNVPSDEAIPVAPAVQYSITDPAHAGTAITAIGFGITRATAMDYGVRRIRTDIPFRCVTGQEAACSEDVGLVDTQAEFVTGGGVCTGDSGSGAYDQQSFDEGTPIVIGTLSRGPVQGDQCPKGAYSRTDAHADMIIAAAVSAAQAGGYDTPSWATSVDPTPDSSGGCSVAGAARATWDLGSALALIVGAALVRRRSRSRRDGQPLSNA